MLVGTEAYAEAASAVPDIVAGVAIYPVGYGEGNTVEEHIAGQILICLGGHNHKTVRSCYPGGKNDDVPFAVIDVKLALGGFIVIAAANTSGCIST